MRVQRVDGPGRALLPVQGAARAGPPDAWLELETVVDRLARLVLLGTACAGHPRPLPVDPAQQQRVARLDEGVALARRALLAAVQVTPPAVRRTT